MIFETLDRIGPFVVVCSQSASIPAKKRRILVRCVNCNATQEMLASSLSDKRLFEQYFCSRCRPRNGNPHTWATRAKFEELKMAMEKDLAEAQAAVRETLTQLRTVLEERDKACRERDSHQQRVARLEEAIVTSLGQRLEPCMSRHPVTVVMAAGALIAKIGEAIGCEFTDGDDLLEAVKGLVRERDELRAWQVQIAEPLGYLVRAFGVGGYDVAEPSVIVKAWRELERERDEARAEVERLRRELERAGSRECDAPACNCGAWHHREPPRAAYRRGAEAMREAAAQAVYDRHTTGLLSPAAVTAAMRVIRALPISEEP